MGDDVRKPTQKLWMIGRKHRIAFLVIVLFVSLGLSFWLRRVADSFDQPYTLIEDGLYVGKSVDRPPRGTTAVVNLCGRPDPYVVQTNLWAPVLETDTKPTLDWLQRVIDFIVEQRRSGRPTYVHCFAGMNRSGTVVTAFLMYQHGWSRQDALTFVQRRRPEVQPNVAMMRLLDQWEVKLKQQKVEETMKHPKNAR